MKLESYRDSWTNQFDWFWVDDHKFHVLSPFFPSKEEAMLWKQEQDKKDSN